MTLAVLLEISILKTAQPKATARPPSIGGLLLGGGFTYYQARIGNTCDDVADFEVVLANATGVDVIATIVNVDGDENSTSFAPLNDIPVIFDSTQLQTYGGLTTINDDSGPTTQRYAFLPCFLRLAPP